MVDFDKFGKYYELINNCEVTDGPLVDYSGILRALIECTVCTTEDRNEEEE